nr:adhesin [Sinorhizobium meliloti]
MQAPTLDTPLQPVAPSPLVNTVDQNPQKPTSLNPNKQKPSKPSRNTGGGSRSGDHYSGVDSHGGWSRDNTGGSSSGRQGTGSKGGKGTRGSTGTGGSTSGKRDNQNTGSYGSWDRGGSGGGFSASGSGTAGSGAGGSGRGNGSFGGTAGVPVLLDLTGEGLSVDPLSSSSFFVDLDGSGYLHRMASAGTGTGMLVLDADGDGKISNASEFVFTEWDKSATGDLEAIKNVFDTNGNGKLDTGDARWSEFKVMIDGQLVSLASLGIAEIDLTPSGSGQNFDDGSAILGTTTFTRTDGSTGTVGDARLAADDNGYLIRRRTTTNADGSVTEDILGYTPDGRLAFRNLITKGADGQSTVTQYDDDGNGTFDRSQRVELATNADGSRTRSISNFNSDGSLRDRTVTITSAGGASVTTTIDRDGDGIIDQSEVFTIHADRSTTTVTKALAADGGVLMEVSVAASADGLSRTTAIDENGDGQNDTVVSDATVVNGDGSRTRTIETRNADGTLRNCSTTTTSANGRSRSVLFDDDGDGAVDERQEVRISSGSDGSATTDIATYDRDGALLGREETTTSADGNVKSARSDLDGDGTVDRITTTARVTQADGSTVVTESVTSADGKLMSRTVTSRSADGKLVTVEADANGDGAVDRLTTIAINTDGTTTEEVIDRHPNGMLAGRSVKVTAADGLSWTRTTDIDGNGTTDRAESATIVVNAEGSRTETVTVKSSDGSLISQTVTTTSADSLTQTAGQDVTGDGVADLIASDRITLNADGSRTEVVDVRSGNGTLLEWTVETVSTDRKTTTASVDMNGDGAIDRRTIAATAADGSTSATDRWTAANGTLLTQSKLTTSRDGLKQVLFTDDDGDGAFEWEAASETILGADGSRTRTEMLRAADGTVIERTVSKASDDDFDRAVETDANGDGAIDLRVTESKRINADGSVTKTVKRHTGTSLVGSTETTTSGNGLTQTVRTDADGNGTVDITMTTLRVLQANGATVDTLTTVGGAGTTLSRTVKTTSADGRTVSTGVDLDGDLADDVTNATVINADGSITSMTSTYVIDAGTSRLQSRTVTTTSADGLVTKSDIDLNGDGMIDRTVTSTTVLNADGSKTATIGEVANRIPKGTTTVTTSANGLSETTRWVKSDTGVTRSRTREKTLNADGSTVVTETYFKVGGTLESKTVTTTSAHKNTTTTTSDIDGDGIVDQKAVTKVNSDGSVTTMLSELGTDGVAIVGKKVVTVSGNGLARTSDYDVNGDGTLEARFVETTALNANGSRRQTVLRQDGTSKTLEKSVTEISADELSVTQKWDVNGDGSFDRSRTDVTTLNATGSTIRTVSELTGATLNRKAETTTNANGLSITKRWDLDGNGTYDQSSTDVTTLNGNGSVTRTITSRKADGSLIGKSVETRSADGRSVTNTEDRTGLGLASRSLVSSKSTLADGSVIETLSIVDAAQKLTEKQTKTTTAGGREISTVRDADGDGKTDQTEVYTRYVDGSQATIITGYGKSGTKIDGTTITTSADGRTTTTSWDLDGNGTVDRLRTTVLTVNADGSETSVSTDTTAAGAVQSKTTEKVSADGRTEVVSRDLNGDGVTDNTETTVKELSGAAVTTTVNNAEARKTTYLVDGDVNWKQAIAAKSEVIADGLGRTTRSDFDGNGTYEYVEVATTQIDGSIVGTITETNAAGTIIAKGTRMESADGRTVKLEKDANNDGVRDQTQTAITHLNGAVTLTTVEWTATGSVKETVTESFSATGKLTRRLTTDSAGRRIGELLLLADGTMTDSAYDGASSKLLSVAKLSKDGIPVTATFYDPLGVETWKEVTQTFDADGRLIKQVQLNDDGTKETTTFDVTDTQTWEQQVDVTNSAGALTQRSFLNDDKTQVTTIYDAASANTWLTLVQYVDAANRLTKQERANDNGTKVTDWYDVTDAQAWTRQTYFYDAAGAQTQRSWVNDDNTKTNIYYDTTATKGYSSLTQYLNAAGKLTQQDQVMDDGTKRIDWYDVADTKTWTQQTDLFDTAGARTQSSFLNDDNTKINTFYDVAKSQLYSSLTDYLDTAGKLTKRHQTLDNGTKQTDWFDIADAQAWAQQTYSYDAAGATTKKAWLNDDGTKTVIYYDVAKTKGYSSLTQYLDAAGKLMRQVQVNDNGTKQTDWYDLADTQAWWQQTDWNNASGALTQRSYLDDSKTRVTTKYDPTDAATWTTIVQNFDTAGKMTKQVKTNDDGTKETTAYDVADSQAWAQQIDLVDSAGKLIQRTYVHDDNTRVVTAYNPSTGLYTSEKHYNASGQLVWSKTPNGGPAANFTHYDYDSTKAWSSWSEIWRPGSAGGPGVQWFPTYSTTWDDGRVTNGKPPIVLDLNGDDHIDLRPYEPSATDGPEFDWDGDGERDATAWVGPEDGLLAIDLAATGGAGSDGLINLERELAFASWVEGGSVASDMEGLRLVFDTNHDNVLDIQDQRWAEFRVWQDKNQNGITDLGELLTMSEAGIKLVNLLPSTEGARAFEDGSAITGTSSMVMTDGTSRLVADTTLSFRSSSLNSPVA